MPPWRALRRTARPRVLFVDQYLDAPNGAGLVLVDLVRVFTERRQLAIAVWSPVLGDLAERLRALGVRVCTDLDAVPWTPDLIHAHHLAESRAAAARFPGVPMIRVCHGKTPAAALERLPSIRAWVGVSEFTCQRIVRETGVAGVLRIPNFVDGRVFAYRPTAGDPSRCVLFSNHVRLEDPGVDELRAGLARHGIALTVLGKAAGATVANPAEVLPTYGLALAVGRSALEATALGVPTVLCDGALLGEACLRPRLDEMSRHNFAFASRALPTVPIADDAAPATVLAARALPRAVWREAAAWVHDHVEVRTIADRWIELYETVLASRSRDGHSASSAPRTRRRWPWKF